MCQVEPVEVDEKAIASHVDLVLACTQTFTYLRVVYNTRAETHRSLQAGLSTKNEKFPFLFISPHGFGLHGSGI